MSHMLRSRLTFVSIAAVAALLVAGSASAQGWAGGHGGGMMSRYDTDGDSKISLSEYEAARQKMFTRMDADNNGAISFAEIDAMEQRMESMGNGRGGARMKARMDQLKAADANGDQSISGDEFKTAGDAEFKALDTNGDGFIDANEAAAMMKR